MTICEKWYFFLALGQAREKQYLMHNPNSHLGQRSFSSALLNLHFVCTWIWQVTIDRKKEKEAPAANTGCEDSYGATAVRSWQLLKQIPHYPLLYL